METRSEEGEIPLKVGLELLEFNMGVAICDSMMYYRNSKR